MYGSSCIRRGALGAAALVIALSGCAQNNHVAGEPSRAPATIVEVENLAWSDVVVYASDGSSRPIRLGLVGTNNKETFQLPAALKYLNGPIQLIARPIAGDAFPMPVVMVSAGQKVVMTLQNQLALSSVAVWSR